MNISDRNQKWKHLIGTEIDPVRTTGPCDSCEEQRFRTVLFHEFDTSNRPDGINLRPYGLMASFGCYNSLLLTNDKPYIAEGRTTSGMEIPATRRGQRKAGTPFITRTVPV